jgi:hypothetical protein
MVGVTVIVAVFVSAEPHAFVTRARNCVVCVSGSVVRVSPVPIGVDTSPFVPASHVIVVPFPL